MEIPNIFPDCSSCSSRFQSVFSALTKDEISMIDEHKSCVEVKKSETLFSQGARPHGLFCVRKGKLKVIRTGSEGKEQIVHLAKNGDIMGYRAILGNDNYSCSGIAIENSRLCFIPQRIFISLVENNAKLALQLMRLFSEELREAEKSIADIAQKPVRERLAQSLLLLKGTYGFEKDESTLNIKTTREDIAAISGTTRETATRMLRDFNEEKIIELKGKKIKILDNQKLLRAANIFDR